jgi:hypothetical protein
MAEQIKAAGSPGTTFGVKPAAQPDPDHHKKDEHGKAKTEQPDLSIHKNDSRVPELTPES